MRSLTNAFANLDIAPFNSPPPVKRMAITFGEEVQDMLEEWCASQGIPVPPEYATYGTDLDKERQAEFAAELKQADEQANAEAEKPAGEKPPFGTPEFWAWARKRKLEKEKEAAAIVAAGGSAPATKTKTKKK